MNSIDGSVKKFGQRKTIAVNDEVCNYVIGNHATKILCIYPNDRTNACLESWIKKNKSEIESKLLEYGALLFRGWAVESTEKFKTVAIDALGYKPLSYVYRSSPRTLIDSYVYTATEYNCKRDIPLHNENSYSHAWPTHLVFGCLLAAASGGQTTLADSRFIYDNLRESIKNKYNQSRLVYIRNYGVVDLPWSEVFQTTDKDEVEIFCKENNIEFRWGSDGGLQTRQLCNTTLVHPVTKENVWFNQAHLFHASATDDKYTFAEGGCDNTTYPRNVYHADGSELELSALSEIRDLYTQCSYDLCWENGDVLVLDNLLVAHGRRAFTGERKLVVVMLDNNLAEVK
jgi:alpha-ketoglutarate-dependent taurine dioxygenase